jgi:hypothetical protein
MTVLQGLISNETRVLNGTLLSIEGRLNKSASKNTRLVADKFEEIEMILTKLGTNMTQRDFSLAEKEILSNGFLNLRDNLFASMQVVSESEQENLNDSVKKILSGLEVRSCSFGKGCMSFMFVPFVSRTLWFRPPL